ncbi:MAG: type II secretion system F family protein [Acidimicrobiia bacterium]
MPPRLTSDDTGGVLTVLLWVSGNHTGLAVTPGQFAIASIGVGLVGFTVVTMVTGTPLVALVPAGAVAVLPRAYFARQRAARLRRVQEAWPDGLRDLLASITAGRSLPQALTTLAASGPVPLQEAFERFPPLSRMLGTVPALEVVKEELADATSDRVIEVLILAQERGGQIVKDILEDLIATTTRDVKVQEEIETEGLEMKINARVVLVLPWVVLVALTIRPGPFREFYQSAGGLLVVALGGVLSVIGYVVISRLGRSQYERRVFGAGAHVGASE